MAEAYLIEKLNSVEQTFQELTRKLADPDVAQDPTEFQRIAKSRSSLEETVNVYADWKQTKEELAGAKEVYKESINDPDLREMASLEVEELEERLASLAAKLKVLLLDSAVLLGLLLVLLLDLVLLPAMLGPCILLQRLPTRNSDSRRRWDPEGTLRLPQTPRFTLALESVQKQWRLLIAFLPKAPQGQLGRL